MGGWGRGGGDQYSRSGAGGGGPEAGGKTVRSRVGEPGGAGESRGEPRGRGRAGKAGRRTQEPRASRRGRAGGALGTRRGDARLPLVRRAGPGTRGGGGCTCRRLRGAVAVRLLAAAAPPPVPGSGQWGGSGRGPARLQWLLRVTGRAGPGEGARVRESGRGAEAGATTVARKGEGVTTWTEPSCAGANSRPAGVGGARSRRRPRSKAGLPKGAWPHPDLRHGAGLV